MVKRKLTEQERRIVMKQMKRIEEEMEHLVWLKEYNDLMIRKGYYMNYMEKLRSGSNHDAELRKDIRIEEEKIKILKEQMKNGVEIKEQKDEGQKEVPGVG